MLANQHSIQGVNKEREQRQTATRSRFHSPTTDHQLRVRGCMSCARFSSTRSPVSRGRDRHISLFTAPCGYPIHISLPCWTEPSACFDHDLVIAARCVSRTNPDPRIRQKDVIRCNQCGWQEECVARKSTKQWGTEKRQKIN